VQGVGAATGQQVETAVARKEGAAGNPRADMHRPSAIAQEKLEQAVLEEEYQNMLRQRLEEEHGDVVAAAEMFLMDTDGPVWMM
jgi:hypothetical protein